MREVLVSRGKVVLDKKDYEEITANLDEIKERYATLDKIVWLYANCDSRFVEEMLSKISRFDEKELIFLWETYQSLSNFGSQCVIGGDEARHSTYDECARAQQAMEKILNYLDKLKVDRSGGAWTTVSRMIADFELTREEIYTAIIEAKDKGLVEILNTLEPGPHGLLSATITDLGRQWIAR